MTNSVLPIVAVAALDRASGSAGPCVHVSKLPLPTVLLSYVSATAFVPSDPPAYT